MAEPAALERTAPAPTVELAQAYIATTGEIHDEADVLSALAAEAAAQSRTCRVPDPAAAYWPADLAQALYRRVLVNLSMRKKPLGVEAAISEAGVGFARVGGSDPEVRRLERPWRKRPVAG